MNVSDIAGSAAMVQSSQTQQALSTAMIKMRADSDDQIAEMVRKNAQQAPQPTKSSSDGFSTYA